MLENAVNAVDAFVAWAGWVNIIAAAIGFLGFWWTFVDGSPLALGWGGEALMWTSGFSLARLTQRRLDNTDTPPEGGSTDADS